MAAFWEFIKALFARKTIITMLAAAPATLALFVTYLLKHFIYGFAWVPTWWITSVALLAGLLLASFIAWRDQYNAAASSAVRPDISLTFRYLDNESDGFTSKDRPGFRFVLKNAGGNTGVNISALPLSVPIPESIRNEWKETNEHWSEVSQGKIEIEEPPREWVARFEKIGCLTPSGEELILNYHIENSGPLHQDISILLQHSADESFRSKLPLVIVFSNLGDPMKTWHAHYNLEYCLAKEKSLNAEFLGFGEVPEGKTICSRCHSV